MQEILVLGAGKIGALICGLLAGSGDYRVQLADKVEGAGDEVTGAHGPWMRSRRLLSMRQTARASRRISGSTNPSLLFRDCRTTVTLRSPKSPVAKSFITST
jgi:3-hydroxyacyl-CoA dehydrogenase